MLNEDFDRKFDMKNMTLGFEQIPGLETIEDNTIKSNWVVFLGFETERLKRMEEEVSTSREYIIPVVCIPSMQVKWHNYAIEVNRSFLDKAERLDRLSYVSAINPFDVYNYLKREKGNHEHMIISPVSTKPVILGVIMYTLQNPRDMLLWDSSYQIQPNTEACGRTIFYDISFFVKNTFNQRYNKE